ncbi:MAG TPA: type IV pilus secretin PilQ [Thermoanaerobaculia bacterium]
MRRTFRATATALALALVWGAAVGCSSRAHTAHDAADTALAAPADSSPSTATPAPPASAKITQAAFNEDADGARVVLSASAPLLYTSYEPRPDLLIVDLRDAAVAQGFAAPQAAGAVVGSIRFDEVEELGKRMTRLSIQHKPEARADVRSVGQGLAIAFSGATAVAEAETAETPAAAEAAPAPVTTEPIATASAASVPAPRVAPAAVAAPTHAIAASGTAASSAARGEVAHSLEKVTVGETHDGQVSVTLLGDGWLAPKDFVLANPPRVVLDLPGVKNEVRQRAIAVNGNVVTKVRVSQFQTSPEFITRVVLDLSAPTAHALASDGERLAVIVGRDAVAAAAAQSSETASARNTEDVVAAEAAHNSGADTVALAAPVAPQSAPEAKPEPAPVTHTAISPAPEPAPVATMSETKPAPAPVPESKPAVVEAKSAVAAAPAPAPAHDEAPMAVAAVSAPPAPAPVSAPAPAPVPVAHKSEPAAPVTTTTVAASRPASSSAKASSSAAKGRNDALFEAAAAALDQEQAASAQAGSAYRSRTIAEASTQFTGEPISLDLKDADIKDVFRTISQLTGLNIVIDPEVRGTVTVQLEDVPWDQALDLILKQNSLGYVLENNIMRIATTAKLQAEEGDRARLAEARQAAEPTRTVIKKLSYARASEITPTLQSVMSKRGSIVIDGRTNTLIIREIPTYLPAVLQLIENLDTATPQVVIESRIVETTKSLGRSLGINWSATGNADNAHGNTTNLIFPNSVAGGINVGLGNGPTVASLVLGNILNTFNLNAALTAAENQGLLKIISSPKVTSLTNTAALIQSGVQIPVQTTVNNTTTVIYVDATLKLDVTPQITAEGTILLNVNVTKREPAVALNLSLGQNVPLTIREYRGQVLVKDGGTTVIGGIFQINDQDQNNMIPGLWKIPVLGNLFRNKTRTEKHDELLIFITPRILRS